MIPLRDTSRQPRLFPIVTVSIIVVNIAMFCVELALGDKFVLRWGVVPADITSGHHLITLVTSMFLHASWLHVLSNMLFLWVFGPSIEDAMGSARYTGFYFLGGLVASIAQVAVAPSSTVVSLGASGAIAAVMGAFLVTYPSDEIRTLVTFGILFATPRIRAWILVGLWFVLQVISVRTSSAAAAAQGGVAYVAHVAGFLFGAVLGRLFEQPGHPEQIETNS